MARTSRSDAIVSLQTRRPTLKQQHNRKTAALQHMLEVKFHTAKQLLKSRQWSQALHTGNELLEGCQALGVDSHLLYWIRALALLGLEQHQQAMQEVQAALHRCPAHRRETVLRTYTSLQHLIMQGDEPAAPQPSSSATSSDTAMAVTSKTRDTEEVQSWSDC